MGLYDLITSTVSLLEGGPEERSQLIRCLQGLPTSDNRTLGRMMASDPVKFIWVNGFINWSLINNNVIVSRIPSSSYYFSKVRVIKIPLIGTAIFQTNVDVYNFSLFKFYKAKVSSVVE